MTRRWPVIGVVFALLWVFVRGVDLALDPLLGQFLLGLAVGMPVAFLFRRLYAEEIELGPLLRSVAAVAGYLVVFLEEVVVANLNVAYRVLWPSMPIEPEVILVPLRVETDVGVTTIANSITITPGTITLDHDPEANALYVHVIDGRDPEAIVEPIRAWEDYALSIFDEERSPADPAPEIAVYPAGYQNPPDPLEREERAERRTEATDEHDRHGGDGDGGDTDGR